jgi:hypothetical protein
VSGAPADTADDVSSKVALLRALILPVTDVAAVLTDLVLVVSKGSVESSKLAKLIAFVIVLAFRCGSGLISKDEPRIEIIRRGDLTVSITLLISLTQVATFSSVSAVTRQWRSSSASSAY